MSDREETIAIWEHEISIAACDLQENKRIHVENKEGEKPLGVQRNRASDPGAHSDYNQPETLCIRGELAYF